MDRPCTLTMWRVLPVQEVAFLETIDRLTGVLQNLPQRPGGLTLLQSIDDPAVFHTVGWFHRDEDLEAMRRNATARQLLDRLVGLCSEFRPSAHSVRSNVVDSTTSAESA